MLPSIFGKPLDELEYSDVIAFCATQPVENLGLDYKKDLSSLEKVVKTLISFANTNGGWVIIGVEDDGNDKPKLPVTGMAFSNDFEQRLTNSIVASVTPIVLPYYKTCVSTDGKTAFLVAYMPQSPIAPHWMQFKGKYQLFIRHSDRSAGDDWENTALPNQWEVLRNRRKASVDLRGQLTERMKDVYEVSARSLMEMHDNQRDEEARLNSPYGLAMRPFRTYFGGEEYEGTQTISLLPTYPTNPVMMMNDLLDIYRNETVRTGYTHTHPETPNLQGYDIKSYQNGVYAFHEITQLEMPYFFGTDVFGNMINVDSVQHQRPKDGGDATDDIDNLIPADRIVGQIINALRFANKTYARIGLMGNLKFRAEFQGGQHCLLVPNKIDLGFDNDNEPRNVTGEYVIERELDTVLLGNDESRKSFIFDVAKDIMYAFNMSTFNEKNLKDFISKSDHMTEPVI